MQCFSSSRFLLVFCVMFFLLVNQRTLAQIPHTLSYQAVLTDIAGSPKPDGMYTITFRLYTALSGGNPVWTESQSLQLKRGLFSAVLGSVTPLGTDLTFTQPYWLSLQAAPDAEMSPRLPLTSSAYSLAPWTSIGSDVYFPGGRVGIGTNSLDPDPGYKLNILGGARIEPGGLGGIIRFGTPNAETGMSISGATGRADVRFDGATLRLVTGPAGSVPTNGIAINSAGVQMPNGIQLAAGAQGNQVQFGSPNSETGMSISGAGGRADLRFDGTLKLVNGPGGIPPATNGIAITNAGNVGIGTTNPTAKLEVIGRTKTGTLEITAGSDLAEPFDTETDDVVDPGSIMVIDALNPGKLKISELPYDARVAGIVSGAGNIKPGITLQQDGVTQGHTIVAIAGRVYCKADANGSPIEPGDLLTTSAIPGHAMKATERDRSHGAIIGKAMSSLKKGTGLVLVLVNLQ